MRRDTSLPIFEIEDALRESLSSSAARVVIEAPTGSGKSTQVPQMLADALPPERGAIYVLQPRRIAARLLARRVAWERNVRLGDEVGFQVRFESAVSRDTRIRYITEGILIRLLIDRPDLSGIAAVVLDEFHERHFYGDVSLARCRTVQRERRPDLVLAAMSATLETEALKEYLGPGTVHLRSEGRTFPVTIRHAPPRERHKGGIGDHVARAIRDHVREHGIEGHALVFLPGRHEIRMAAAALRRAPWARDFAVHELYGELSPEKQDAAVDPSGVPKIVLATNVAETSLTIDGVRLVVDSGLERRSAFDYRRGLETLHIRPISRASADQRAGRAGRTAAGTAIRLWSERDHENRESSIPAEIHRMDPAEAVLILLASGVEDVRDFPWFEAPAPAALDRAMEELSRLGAIDDSGRLMETGDRMSRLPLPPRFARILLAAGEAGCLEFFAVVAALMQGRPLFRQSSGKGPNREREAFTEPDDSSDFLPLFRAWRYAKDRNFDRRSCEPYGVNAAAARDVDRMANQFSRITGRLFPRNEVGETIPSDETLGRVLLTGFSENLAIRNNPSTLACSVVAGRRGQVDKESVATRHTGLFLAGEMIEIEGRELSVRLQQVTILEEAWVRDLFPDDFAQSDAASWSEATRRVEGRRERRFRDLVLESKGGGSVDGGEAASLLARKVLDGELNLKAWDDSVREWFARVNLVAEAFPEYGIPPIDDDAKLLLLEQICAGAMSYKEIKDRPVRPAIQDWLLPNQRDVVDRMAPERLALPRGKRARIHYVEGEKPRLSALIQHLFHVKETPAIADGRVPLLVEILAPNHRPVQVTEDLAGFWQGSYAAVRNQLRGRYPKHEWPEPE